MRALSVVVVGDSPIETAVRELAATWTRAGIVEPSLWVSPGDVVLSEYEPPRVQAHLLEANGERAVDLFAYLGRFRIDLVRVVVAQLATVPGGAAIELSAMGSTIAAAIKAALPLTPTGEGAAQLHRSVVVIPASGVGEIDPRVLNRDWEANVVISPEDRPDVDHSNIYVRSDVNFVGHATAALSAAAGIVRGIDGGAFDGVSSDSSTSADDVVVARVSLRTVVGDDVLDVLTSRVLEPSQLAPAGPGQIVEYAHVAGEPELITKRAVQSLLKRPEWAAGSAPAAPQIERARESFAAALSQAAKFSLRTVSAVAAWTVSSGRASLERSATDRIVGTGAGALVTIGPRAIDNVGPLVKEALEAERAAIEERLAYEATRGTPPAPSTWSSLRALAFGLADGGPLEDMEVPRQFGKREVLEPGDVTPIPGNDFIRINGAGLPPNDPIAIREYQTIVEGWIGEHRTDVGQRRSELTAIERAAFAEAAAVQASTPQAPDGDGPVSDEAADEPGKGEADKASASKASAGEADSKAEASDESAKGEDDKAPAAKPKAAPKPEADAKSEAKTTPKPAVDSKAIARLAELESARTAAQARLTESESRLLKAEEHRDAFAQWFEDNSRSVVWRVGDDVARRLVGLERRRRAYRDAQSEPTAPVTAALERAKKRVLRIWQVSLPIMLALIAATIGLAAFVIEEPDWSLVWWICGAILAIEILILIFANHAFYKAFRRYEWELEHAVARDRHEAQSFLWAGKELARLRITYAGWRDWATIIGEVIHRPWQAPSRTYTSLSDEVVERLPAAMAAARQRAEEVELPPELVGRAYRQVYREGWASLAFEEDYATFSANLGVPQTSGYLEADIDVTGGELTARTRLRERWTAGQARVDIGKLHAAKLRTLVAEGTLDLPTREVGRLGQYWDGEWVPEPGFFAATATSGTTLAVDAFSSRGKTSSRHYIQRVRVWLPQIALRLAKTQSERDSDRQVTLKSAEAATAMRVDLSRRITLSDLSVFALGKERGVERAGTGGMASEPQGTFI